MHQKFRSGLAGTDARNVPSLFLNVFGNRFGIKSHGRIKIGEYYHQQKIGRGIESLILNKVIKYTSQLRNSANIRSGKKISDHPRKKKDRQGKDNRHHPGIIDSHWQISRDSAVHLGSPDPFGIIDGNISLGFGKINHSGNNYQSYHSKTDIGEKLGIIKNGGGLL